MSGFDFDQSMVRDQPTWNWSDMKDLETLFGGVRVSKKALNRILDEWGEDAVEMIKRDPFILVDRIDGIGFVTADQLFFKMGSKNHWDEKRIRAGIKHVLNESGWNRGHVCMPKTTLEMHVRDLLQISTEMISPMIEELKKGGELIEGEGMIYLTGNWVDEAGIAIKIQKLIDMKVEKVPGETEGLMWDQDEAVFKATSNGIFILTGAPGTGKTFTIKKIIESFNQDGKSVLLAAPTGKAAKRMYEQSGYVAATIHKLLEATRGKGNGGGGGGGWDFKRGVGNPLIADLIILDEVSMIDNHLMKKFLDAVGPETRLILVGDTYQLPAVGPGNVLKDLIASGKVPFSELTVIKRQDPGKIIVNCHRIKNGEEIEGGRVEIGDDFVFMEEERAEEIQKTLLAMVKYHMKEPDSLKNLQVIVPLREKTILSVKTLNELLQRELNPNPPIEKHSLRLGDKVIQLKNDYDKGIFNGDIGFINGMNEKTRTLTVEFESPKRTISLGFYKNDLQLAYAITCHKFQGSEVDVVIIPIHSSFGPLIMQRNWLYTAISRAKKLCVMIGQRGEVKKTIDRNQQQRRYTRLRERIEGLGGESGGEGERGSPSEDDTLGTPSGTETHETD